MLKRFSVKNFKNFKDTVTLELDRPANYEFNSEIIEKECITKSIIYGINGSGKSNLALAIFDIIMHLTDKERAIDKYQPYRNLESKADAAEFEYVFTFNGQELVYSYGKKDPMNLSYEKLIIGGKDVLGYDFEEHNGFVQLAGAEHMQLSLPGVSGADNLSRVKYVRSNAALIDNEENKAFISFISFVDNMLMFYSLSENRYQGFNVGSESYTQGIIRERKLKEFEQFLRKIGIDYKLMSLDLNGSSEMFCKFENGNVPFATIASTGTRSLGLFYYWYLKMERASFVFMDEFDAFYHFELAQEIVELLKRIKNTQIILSTHNTDLISNDILRPDAYFRIANNQIRSVDKISEKELRRAHNMQKMFKAGAFND